MERENLNPIDVLKGFIDAMFKWNIMCLELDKIPGAFHEQKEMIREKLNIIFDEYLTQRDRKYAQQLSFSNPPEYNLATNEILSCTEDKKKAYIEVQETVGFKEKLKYTLHKKKDGWRIDKKEIYDEFKDKWNKDIL